ncbi:MAG: methionine--tRNA ligase [Candidatus Niyogibacteria bacterium]|nr:methionine--tRNA ligase [Candidatus Niyogibacteria bacterium]
MSKNFYITTAIAYVNAPPHMGFAKEAAMADVIARYNKLLGKEVYFLTGTDEHGAKIARSAEKEGVPVRDFVDGNSLKVRDLLRTLNISNNDFIRTSDEARHWPAAVLIWKKLAERGDIYKKSYQGLYCVGHEAFITEKDLIDGKCADHGQAPEVIEEENYFFRLSKYTDKIKSAVESGEMEIVPVSRKNEILALLAEGLEDVSFSRPSRDISWGVPVPEDPEQTMYVWCDALTNYISALGFGSGHDELFQNFWPADIHLIGKDILRFHAAIWPAMLLSAGLPLPKKIVAHGFITSGGQKMSKTLGNVVDPFAMVGKYGAEAVRYFLLRETSTFEDGDFTEDKLRDAYNANLANGLGNLVSRTSKMIKLYADGAVSRPDEDLISSVPFKKNIGLQPDSAKEEGFETEYFSADYVIEKFILPEYERAMNELNLQKAGDAIWRLVGELDHYVQNYEPFKLVKTDREKTLAVLWNLAYGVSSAARMLLPFMPETATKIFDIFGITPNMPLEKMKSFTVKDHVGLFPRLDKEAASK